MRDVPHRAFCDNCIDKLGEGTAALVEASDDDWLCPCCDESALGRLQVTGASHGMLQ